MNLFIQDINRQVWVCNSLSDLRRYSDKGDGGGVVVCVLYAYCQSYSDLRGYSNKGGGVVVGW